MEGIGYAQGMRFVKEKIPTRIKLQSMEHGSHSDVPSAPERVEAALSAVADGPPLTSLEPAVLKN